MHLTLAKCLKLKNRLAQRLNEVRTDITTYNSVLREQLGQVDREELLRKEATLYDALVALKSTIATANQPIQKHIMEMGEIKARIAHFQSIPTTHGEQRHSYQNTSVEYVAHLKKGDVDELVHGMERLIDALQDKLDAYNQETKVFVDDELVKLAQ